MLGSKNFFVRSGLLAALILLFTFSLAASASAVTISASNFQCQDSSVVGDRYCKVHVKITGTGQSETGLIELGFNDASPAPPALLSFIMQQQPCEQRDFPYNTIFKYLTGDIGGYNSVEKDLVARAIPDGTYLPYLIHVTGCFNAGGAFKQPNPIPLPSGTVTFGDAGGNVQDQCDNPYTALQWVKAKGDLACTAATCSSPETSTSIATCTNRGVCADGAEQWQTCSDGSSFRIRLCSGGQWSISGQKCPAQPLTPEPEPTTPETVKASLGGGVPVSKMIILIGSVLFVVWLFRRFGRRFF